MKTTLGVRDWDEEAALYRMMPGWHAVILGPHPFGAPLDARIGFQVTAIVQPTKEKAEEMIWMHVQQTCREYGFIYDPDDWEIESLIIVNGN